MKTITAFEADDGTKFFSRELCLQHELECRIAADALAGLRLNIDIPDGMFVRQDIAAVWRARAAILDAWCSIHGRDKYRSFYAPHIEARTLANGSTLGRIMDDGGPLACAMARLDKIDAEGRDWSQLYYCLNDAHDKSTGRKGEFKPEAL